MSETIAVFASARRNGNTGKFIDRISEISGCDVIDLAEKNISPYDYEHNNFNDDFIPVMEEILDHKIIIFVSPVYWYSMSAQMKIFIDRMSDFLDVKELEKKGKELRGKICYVVCTSVSQKVDESFINSFKNTFEYLGMEYGGHIHANCIDGFIANQYAEDIDNFVQSINNSIAPNRV